MKLLNLSSTFFCLCLLLSNISFASDSSKDSVGSISKEPAYIEADNLFYDKKTKNANASGNVEVTQGKRILLADKVVYNEGKDSVEAEGNISILEPDGTVLFADKVILTDNFKQGIIENFSARFRDTSLIIANKAERKDKGIVTLEEVVYSPCPLCKEKKDKAPLWQIKSKKTIIDEDEQRISYRHAFFEIYGVPVLYTPYLSHATPGADRKSGFLIPKYSSDRIFGTKISTPYYFNIAPNKDLTLIPTYTTNEGSILSGEYRHLLNNGRFKFAGSITNPDEVDNQGNPLSGKKVRGHIEGEGEIDISQDWNWGFVGKRVTDDTYLRRYNFGDEDVLTSRMYVQNIEDKNYVLAQTITFQGLKTNDDPGKAPLILPYIDIHKEDYINASGLKWTADANFLALTRDEGTSSKRTSLNGGLVLPYTTKTGHVFEFSSNLRGDVYSVDDVLEDATNTQSQKLDGTTGRVIPTARAKWSYPLAKLSDNGSIFIEPVADVIVSPHGGNPDKIPDEDSQDVEFSDNNLFTANHFNGLDRVEGGPRSNYGVRGGMFDDERGDINFIFGQTYRAKRDNDFNVRSGLADNFSDYVGKIAYEKNDIFNLTYRFRVDKDSFSTKRNSVSAGANIAPVKFNMDYLSLDENFNAVTATNENRELMLASSTIDISTDWSLSASGHRDLEDGDWISTKADLFYKGKCVDLIFSWFKEFTRDRDIRPNTTLSFRIALKNIGY